MRFKMKLSGTALGPLRDIAKRLNIITYCQGINGIIAFREFLPEINQTDQGLDRLRTNQGFYLNIGRGTVQYTIFRRVSYAVV